MKGVEAWAATGVLAGHLANHHLRVGEDAQHLGFESEGVLQGFEQGDVLGYVVVLVPDPLRDPDLLTLGILDDDTNPRWSWTAMRAAINVGNKY